MDPFALARFMHFAPDDNGGKPADKPSKSDDDKKGDNDKKGDDPKFSDEETELLKRVGVDPKDLKPETLLKALFKAGHFKGKADEQQKRISALEAAERARESEKSKLKMAKLIDKEGKIDVEALEEFQKKVISGEELSGLLQELVDRGFLTGKVAEMIKDKDKSPGFTRQALDLIEPPKSTEIDVNSDTFKSAVDKEVQAVLKAKGVNTDDRKYDAGDQKSKDEMAEMVKDTNVNLKSVTTGERRRPGEEKSGGN